MSSQTSERSTALPLLGASAGIIACTQLLCPSCSSSAAFLTPSGLRTSSRRSKLETSVTSPSSLRGSRGSLEHEPSAEQRGSSAFFASLGVAAGLAGIATTRRRAQAGAHQQVPALVFCEQPAKCVFTAPHRSCQRQQGAATGRTALTALAAVPADELSAAADAAGIPPQAWAVAVQHFVELLGPAQAASAAATATAEAPSNDLLQSFQDFFFDKSMQWDENGDVLKDPQGNPLPDNLWTQFVAFQATLIERIEQGIRKLGIPGSLGVAVACYTLLIRVLLYPFVKSQLETTAKIQVLAPTVNELKEKYKDNEERLQQEVGLLYMDLQIDPLGAVFPLLLQLPVFWGLYRAVRRLAIVEYPPLKEGFLWIPSLYGPNFKPDPSFDWLLQWQGPLISLHPKMGWESFGLYALLPLSIFISYRIVLAEALADENAPKLLQFTPFLLAGITSELPQAMGIYIATNIASSLALTTYTKEQLSSKIPGYDEFVKNGKWPPGVDPEKVLAKAFGVTRLSQDESMADPGTVPEAVFAGRADYIPVLLNEKGRDIDEFDDRGIPASAYTLALNNTELLTRLFELGANPQIIDRRGNSLLHYCAGYGRGEFLKFLLEKGLKEVLNVPNEDGQTPLDVARTNLSVVQVADDVREIIKQLEEVGAEGKATTKADEAIYEEAREKKIKEDQVNAARSALKALAMAADKNKEAVKAKDEEEKPVEGTHSAPVEHEVAQESSSESLIGSSLDRVRSMDIDTLKHRLGGQMSEEQLQKLSERLSKMTPEDLASFAAGTSSVVKAAVAEKEAQAAADGASDEAENGGTKKVAEKRRESVIVD
eukprot:TRINITY_DN7044_c0_g1_i3.p1 TRINITY_DN7044_c0_g1~~TRINITY_DN7044_c0_g1_i3.p1  ORF type:complete len:826 (+),score=202.28 TRINITY_DN7044_c0_g1_i3:261-2738(+)